MNMNHPFLRAALVLCVAALVCRLGAQPIGGGITIPPWGFNNSNSSTGSNAFNFPPDRSFDLSTRTLVLGSNLVGITNYTNQTLTINATGGGGGSGFPLTADGSLAGHTLSNGAFNGTHVGDGSGLTNLPPSGVAASNVAVNGYSATGFGSLSASNLVALSYISTTGTVYAASVVVSNAFGAVAFGPTTNGLGVGGSLVMTYDTMKYGINFYSTPTNLVSGTNITWDVGTNGWPNGAVTLATNAVLSMTNAFPGETGMLTVRYSGAARTLTFTNGAYVIGGTMSTNVAKATPLSWYCVSNNLIYLNIGPEGP